MEKQYLIPESTINALILYMQKRPYEEVTGGIQALRSLPEATNKTIKAIAKVTSKAAVAAASKVSDITKNQKEK